MEFIKNINDFTTELLNNMGIFAPIIASILISLEAVIPILPLGVFITFNYYYLGSFWGFLVSWIFTCLGSYLVFKLSKMKVRFWIEKKVVKKHERIYKKLLRSADNLKLEQLTVLMSITFIPAIVLNLVLGTLGVKDKKYLIALLIGKIFEVSFWGIFGTSLLDSFKNPTNLIILICFIGFAFIITKFLSKKYRIN